MSMNTSSPQSPKPPQKKAVLLIGPPGSRKTTLMLQFPKLAVFDLDSNLDGPELVLRKGVNGQKPIIPNLSYSYTNIVTKADGTARDLADCYDELIGQMKDFSSDKDHLWGSIDGLTSVNECIIRKIMKEQRISYMEGRNWSTFKSDAVNLLFTKLRHVNHNMIVTAHEVRVTKNDPKQMMQEILLGYEPFLQGKSAEMLGGFFTDVWRLEAVNAPGDKIETTLYTDKVPLMTQLKNSFGMPAVIKNPSYEVLKPYIEGSGVK